MHSRLGEAGVDAFSIMKIAGHSSVTVSQKYLHPSRKRWSGHLRNLELLNAHAKIKIGIELGIGTKDKSSVASTNSFY
jgi:hypothetical protein